MKTTYEVDYLDLEQKSRVQRVIVDEAFTHPDNIRTIIALKLGGVTRIKSFTKVEPRNGAKI